MGSREGWIRNEACGLMGRPTRDAEAMAMVDNKLCGKGGHTNLNAETSTSNTEHKDRKSVV